jgi:hypothetical protein
LPAANVFSSEISKARTPSAAPVRIERILMTAILPELVLPLGMPAIERSGIRHHRVEVGSDPIER